MFDFLSNTGNAKQVLGTLALYAVLIGGMYFFLFRPQQKKRKQDEEMRKSIEIGDEITTIGGIVGRVVSIKEDSDSLVLETGSEKIRIKKWAIATNNNISKDNEK